MTLFIQGLAIPLDTKNKNGWGVPSSDVDNVISSLPASTLKICPGEAHACDFSGDPNGIIGHYASHWLEADGIHAKYEVTDSVAQRKLKEGSWKDFKWSMYGGSKNNPILNDGWTSGTTVKNMTLVKNPAWSQAQYQISASADGETKLRLFSDFQLIASDESLKNSTEGDQITYEEELKQAKTDMEDMQSKMDMMSKKMSASDSTIENLNGQIATLTASIAEKDKSLNLAVVDVTEAKTQVETLAASVKDLETKLNEKTTLVASLEKEKAGSVPMENLQSIIAAAIEKHDAEKSAANERAEALKLFASAREGLGLETKPEDFTSLSAADMRKLADDMGTVKISASSQIRYPAAPKGANETFATGAYDARTGEWKK